MTQGRNIKEQFGITIRYYRIRQNLSQEELAELSGLHRTYISEVERGERNISLENMHKIALALSTTLSEIFSVVEDKGEL